MPQVPVVAQAEQSARKGQPDGVANPHALDAPVEDEAAEVADRHGNNNVADEGNHRHGSDVADAPEGIGIGDLQGIAKLVSNQDDYQCGNHLDDLRRIGKEPSDDVLGKEEYARCRHGKAEYQMEACRRCPACIQEVALPVIIANAHRDRCSHAIINHEAEG